MPVAKSADIHEGEIFVVKTHHISLLLTRIDGRLYAVENKCPHLGLSMARGSITGLTIQCPWHGSRFDICSGKNLDWVNGMAGLSMPRWTHKLIALGRKPADLRTFSVSENGQEICVQLPGPQP